ncbi:hypothetical protein FPY71_00010 [Aureimonas fodinaquatilis]|uniref:Uncharacterized protein n=1 Tax=Aureimonas fodinaquatilis TaxID=2565783 RepID=A0A5B0E0C6_9HYPH|nr:hypothetical protein [Aureimonas fodinaquatilis]KAA0971565.1 hypothetical protein FPY71_00010 [Aureimonas fodinaquatilis]
MSLSHTQAVDPELKNLIEEALAAGLLGPNSEDSRIAGIVAAKGQSRLSLQDRAIWEARILPILAKPFSVPQLKMTLSRPDMGIQEKIA